MSIEDLIQNVSGKNFAQAQGIFDGLMQDKMNAALEQEKIKLAGQTYNGDPEEDEDLEDDDIEAEEEELEDEEEADEEDAFEEDDDLEDEDDEAEDEEV
jgi:hypothetical protein|tara:strand:- start:389 stop:685 length:297 start_codon:yes stop_codon:yes gene_type:complete